MKRAIDLVAAVLGLLALAPLLALVALAVAATSPGPPVFRQRRVGRGGREFVMWKFRTMVAGAEEVVPLLIGDSRDENWLDLERDPRITAVGRVLRRTSIDELPQLLNVLRGEMSLVGPRPLPLDEDARVPQWARTRESVRPGMTGLWQVQGRANLGFMDMLSLDCEYVREPSLWTDAKILARTVAAVLSGKGAT